MPRKCYNKPNRSAPRLFRAKDVGRVACAALENGESPAKIRAAVAECVGSQDEECEKAKESLKLYAGAVSAALALVAFFLPVARGLKSTIRVFRLVFPKQAARLDDLIEKTLTENEKTKQILDDIIRRARELELETA